MTCERSFKARRFLLRTKPILTHVPLWLARPFQNCFGYFRVPWRSLEVSKVQNKNFLGALVSPQNFDSNIVIMYLHGGSYSCGGYGYARNMAGYFADKLEVRVFGLAYDLAPEHKFPAPLINAVYAYNYLLHKFGANNIYILGESAGGGLAYALCMRLRDENIPQPRGIINMSPWTDLTLSQDTYTTNAAYDVTLSLPSLQKSAEQYAGKDLKNPYVSPLRGDLSGLPETLMFVSTSEILYDDARVMCNRLTHFGCKATLREFAGLWHVFPVFDIPESQIALDIMRDFLSYGR